MSPVAAMSPFAARSPPAIPSPALRGTPPTPHTPKTPNFFSVTPSSAGTSTAAIFPALLQRTNVDVDMSVLARDSPVVTPPLASADVAGPVLLGRRVPRQVQASPVVASDCSTCAADDSPSFLAERARSAYKARTRRIATRFPGQMSAADSGVEDPAVPKNAMPTLLDSSSGRHMATRDAAGQISLEGFPLDEATTASVPPSLDDFDKKPFVETVLALHTKDIEALAHSAAVQARKAYLDRQQRIVDRPITLQL